MRVIKFRAWHKKEKKMYQLDWNDGLGYSRNSIRYRVTLGDYSMSDKQYKFMQFTGLKDKRKKDIFEGDIVEYTTDDNSTNTGLKSEHKIFFSNGGFMIEFPLSPGGKTGVDLRIYNDKCEVIGNVYEKAQELKDDRGDDSGKYENKELME